VSFFCCFVALQLRSSGLNAKTHKKKEKKKRVEIDRFLIIPYLPAMYKAIPKCRSYAAAATAPAGPPLTSDNHGTTTARRGGGRGRAQPTSLAVTLAASVTTEATAESETGTDA